MKSKILLSIVLICLLMTGMSCNKGDKTVKIQFKFKPNMTLNYSEDSKGSSRSMIGDSILEDKYSEATGTIMWKVKSIREDSAAEIERAVKWSYRKLDKKDSTWSDTAGSSDNIFIFMKPDGEVVDLISKGVADEKRVDYLRQYYEQGMPRFPAGEISRGHSWSQTVKVLLPEGNTKATTRFEIKSFARKNGYDCAVIAYDGNMIIPVSEYANEEYQQFGGVDRIRATGHTYFAYREGFIVAQQERWLLEGSRERVYAPATDTVQTGSFKTDTVEVIVQYEYDVNYLLTGVGRE